MFGGELHVQQGSHGGGGVLMFCCLSLSRRGVSILSSLLGIETVGSGAIAALGLNLILVLDIANAASLFVKRIVLILMTMICDHFYKAIPYCISTGA